MLTYEVLNPNTSIWTSFKKVCARGYSALGTYRPEIFGENPNAHPWILGKGYPPSYPANTRLRFVTTLQAAKAIKARKILEIAAGDGELLACLAEDAEMLVWNDLRPTVPNRYWKEHANKITFAGGNCLDLDFHESFDLLLACEILEHVAHGDQFLKRISTYLKPGGYLLLTTPNGAYFRSKLPTYTQLSEHQRIALESQQFKPDADGHLMFYTRQELTHLLEESGFTNIKIRSQISPWISGEFCLRILPQNRIFLPLYAWLERMIWLLPNVVRDRLTNNLLVICEKSDCQKNDQKKDTRLA